MIWYLFVGEEYASQGDSAERSFASEKREKWTRRERERERERDVLGRAIVQHEEMMGMLTPAFVVYFVGRHIHLTSSIQETCDVQIRTHCQGSDFNTAVTQTCVCVPVCVCVCVCLYIYIYIYMCMCVCV